MTDALRERGKRDMETDGSLSCGDRGRSAKGCWPPPEAGRGKNGLPRGSEEHDPANTWIPDF